MAFGLFSKERSLKRAMDKVTNKFAQSADRFAAMDKLRQAGSDEALFGLCKRFSFNYDKTIEDEQEKQWVYETLCGIGEPALAPLHRYMKQALSVAFPLRVLERVATPDKALEVIDDLLKEEQPGYTRDPSRRIQIIDWLADYHDAPAEAVNDRVRPYLVDYDENVRFSAVEAIAVRPTESMEEPLCEALTREEEESKRLKMRIAEVLCDGELDLGGSKAEITAMLDDLLSGYKIQHDKLVKQ